MAAMGASAPTARLARQARSGVALKQPALLRLGLRCLPLAPNPRLRPPARGAVPVVRAAQQEDPMAKFSKTGEVDVRLRGEAEAPWRPVRLVLFGFSIVSASVGTLTSLPQLIAALGGARNALPTEQVVQNLGINVGVIALCGYLFYKDKQAEKLQLARLTREERLGAQYVELIGGKLVRLREMRSFVRIVVVAGTREQVKESIAAAEPLKEKLMERGVMIIALPIFDEDEGNGQEQVELSQSDEDKRYVARAVRLDGWRSWFAEQMGMSKVKQDAGLYISLRLDGRVRGSGRGPPPWERLAASLAPMEGMWKGFLDGMDGRV